MYFDLLKVYVLILSHNILFYLLYTFSELQYIGFIYNRIASIYTRFYDYWYTCSRLYIDLL